jgi:hypothetical protein
MVRRSRCIFRVFDVELSIERDPPSPPLVGSGSIYGNLLSLPVTDWSVKEYVCHWPFLAEKLVADW